MRISIVFGADEREAALLPPNLAPIAEMLNDRPQLSALNAVAFLQLELQFSALDARAGHLLGVGSAVLPVSFVLLNLRDGNPPNAATWWLVAALLAYLVLLVCYLQAARIQDLDARPDLKTLKSHVLEENERAETIAGWLADEFDRSINLNVVTLTSKQRQVGRATLALCIEGICLTIAAVTAADLLPSFPVRFW